STTSNSSYGGDPVDLSTGAYVYAVEDMSVGGIHGEYSFRRFYNSQLNYFGPLGHNWTHSYDIGLEINGSQWTIRHGNGQRTYFTGYNDGTAYPNHEGTLDSLSRNTSTGEFFFTKTNGTVYRFNATGCIEEITDRSGNTISFQQTNCQLARIVFPGGRYIDFSYAQGLLSTATDNIGRSVSYMFDSSSNLSSTTDVRGNSDSFTYDASHQMLEMVDRRGNSVVTNTYSIEGQVVSQLDASGFQTTINYDTPEIGETQVINPLGGIQIHRHNSYFRLTRFINEVGGVITLGYDGDAGKISSYSNELGKTIFYDHDANGNIRLIQDQLANQTLIDHGVFNRPNSVTNALGHQTTMILDANGNAIQVTLANGGVVNSVFNGNSELISRTTPLGRTTTFQRNAFGDITEITTPTGAYAFARDDIGRMTSITDRNGNTISMDFDEAGNITEITDAKGNSASRQFDENGNLVQVTDRVGGSTILEYDNRDLLIRIIDPIGNTRIFEYDALRRLVRAIDANGNEVIFTYDPRGQLLTVVDSLGTYSFEYDLAGNMVAFTDALGNTTNIEYDNANRPVSVIDPLGNESETVYDAIGQVISSTDANNNTTIRSYDVMGWLTSITDALGGVVQYNRDLEGNLNGYTDANGHTTTITRNVLDLPIAITYPGGNQRTATYDDEGILTSLTDENGITATHTYDENYNRTATVFSNGESYAYSFDLEDRLFTFSNSNGTTTLERDLRGFITRTIDPFGSEMLSTFDGEGNRTSLTYPDGNTVTTTFNAVNLPVTVSDWLGNSSNRSYDANGNLVEISRSNSTTTTITRDALQRIETYEDRDGNNDLIGSYALDYDPVGNILNTNADQLLEPSYIPVFETLLYADDDRPTQEGDALITHDNNGARVSVNGDPTESYTWIQEDLLASYIRNGGTVNNTYDPFGQRTSRTEDGQTTQFTLDQTTPLSMVLEEREGGSVSNQYIYGPDGLDWMVDNQGNAQFFHFNFMGHTRALTNENGEVTDAYASDPWGDFAT
ncbi:MAG: DUF6531 domain-containing protein, partial [Bacteroidota bacterium]